MKAALFGLLICLATSLNGNCQSKDTTIWTVLVGGEKAGFTKKWKNGDNSFTEWFQWSDRGRGDSTISTYRYNEQGYITFIDAKGVDYFKKPIIEKFENVNGQVRWENTSEKEARTVNYSAEYLPVSIFSGTLYHNYFNAPNNTIKLLPSGESTLTILKDYILKDGKHIRLISTFGSGFTPSYLWIDENNELFALPGDWWASIRLGYESYNAELIKIQDEFIKEYFKELSRKLTEIQSGLVIKNASVFDSKTGTVQENTTIVIENGVIREVTKNKNVRGYKNYKVIDATGKFVMPGLWDNHVHYGDQTLGFLNIGCGITNVRDMGTPVSTLDRKKEIDNGIVIGPRIQVMSGLIDGAGPYALTIGEVISSAEEGKLAVKKFYDLGYQQIKLYSSLNPEWVKPIVDEAKRLGLRVSGHIPSHMLAEEAIRDGYDEIQHMNMLFLNFYGKDLDTRTPLRFSTIAQRAASFDFNSKDFKSFISILKQHKTVIDPTVSFFEDMFSAKLGEVRPSAVDFANQLPVTVQRSFKTGSAIEVPSGQEETYKKSFLSLLKMIKALYDNEITIIPGTDDFPGFALHRELENYVKAGIPNKDVLKFATLTSAQVNRRSDQYGSIEPNRPADIIIIDGNPLVNIKDIQKVETVIKDKAVYQTKDVLKAVSIKSY
jgi:imidazolonepropionase-like amidohydrolase